MSLLFYDEMFFYYYNVRFNSWNEHRFAHDDDDDGDITVTYAIAFHTSTMNTLLSGEENKKIFIE